MNARRPCRMASLVSRGPWRYVIILLYIIFLIITVRMALRDPCASEGEIVTIPPADLPAFPKIVTAAIVTVLITSLNSGPDACGRPIFANRGFYSKVLYMESVKKLRIKPLATEDEEGTIRRLKVNWDQMKIPRVKDQGVRNQLDDSLNKYHYSHTVSQRIPLSRDVPDTRHPRCGNLTYIKELPPVSLILTLHNEHISVILRALYGIHNRTPPELLLEIILVVISEPTYTVKSEILSNFPNITVMTSEPELGMIGARNLAVQKSKSSVLAFIHLPMEVNHNWLPPLLEPIVLNRRVLSSPLIDTVDKNNFTYWSNASSIKYRTGFNWHLDEQLFERIQSERNLLHLPFISPMVELRAFVINRSHLLDLEGFNTSLDPLSSGHQIDFSLKVWLCGGQILTVPCSKIGFIYKRLSTALDHTKSCQKLKERWFDEFGEFFTTGFQSSLTQGTEIQSVIEPRDKLVCKPFRWYLEKVLPELILFQLPYNRGYKLGVIQNLQCKLCVSVTDTEIEQSSYMMPLENCSNPATDKTNNIHLMSDGRIELTMHDLCLALSHGGGAIYRSCSSLDIGQLFVYDNITQTLQHRKSKKYLKAAGHCLKANVVTIRKINERKQFKTVFEKWVVVDKKADLLKPVNISSFAFTKTRKKKS